MFSKIINNFKNKPTLFYAFSIAATWANAGSLINGVSTAQKNGIIPYLLWAVGNTLACIVFGIFAPRIPKLREVYKTKVMKIITGIMCPFQCWISMNGIQTAFADTKLGANFGIIVAVVFALFFIALLYKFGTIRNILTDHVGWTIVYVGVFAVTVGALVTSKGAIVSLPIGVDAVGIGLKNCLLLIPGAFLYPYYFELLDYNDNNSDGAKKINIQRAFIGGGLVFGIYLVFIFLMSLAVFNPVLNIIKAFLITLIAISSLSSFIYSIYLTFGKGFGLIINVMTVALWQFLIPLGVMGAWTLMASVRIYVVAFSIIWALLWYIDEKYPSSTKREGDMKQ